MKTFLFILMVSIGWMNDASAASFPKKKLHLGKHHFEVHEVREGVWVTDHCLKSCDALKAVDLVHSKPKQPTGDLGGKNPWSWICLNRAGGLVVLVGDESGHQNS